jgi:hypothetical protein
MSAKTKIFLMKMLIIRKLTSTLEEPAVKAEQDQKIRVVEENSGERIVTETWIRTDEVEGARSRIKVIKKYKDSNFLLNSR